MPMELWQIWYLILVWKDLSNQVEGRPLQKKFTKKVCRFLLEDKVCRYRCIEKIIIDHGELDAHETGKFLKDVELSLYL